MYLGSSEDEIDHTSVPYSLNGQFPPKDTIEKYDMTVMVRDNTLFIVWLRQMLPKFVESKISGVPYSNY